MNREAAEPGIDTERKSFDQGFAAWAARWRVPLGFALGITFLVWSRPAEKFLVAGSLIGLIGIGIRAAAAGYLEKGRALATAGPYRYTRNPLYLGSFVLGAGLAVAGASWPLALAFVILYALIYGPVMRREEAALRGQYGEAFARYAAAVPLFLPGLPKPQNASEAGDRFRWDRYLKNHEYEAVLGYLLVMVFLAIKMRLG